MVIYLVLLFLVWFDFFGLSLIPITGDAYIVFLLLYIIYGVFRYRKRPRTVILSGKLRLFWFIVVGIILSTIPCYLYWGQSFYQSILTYKGQYTWIIIPALFVISPQEKELIKALKILFFLMLVDYLGKFYAPQIFLSENDKIHMLKGETDFTVGGYELMAVLFCYYLQKIRANFDFTSLFYVFLIFAFIFCMQNRSTLFPCVLFLGITLLSMKSKYRLPILVVICCFAFYVFTKTAETWIALIEQTESEASNEEYARNMSYAYFLNDYSPNWLCDIFGNGFISANTNSIFADLLASQITQSDVGFIGFWNQFGIIPIISFILLPVIAFKVRGIPYYLKLVAAFTLICSPTISYYGSRYHAIVFVLLYYLLFLHLQRIYNERGLLGCPAWIKSLIC